MAVQIVSQFFYGASSFVLKGYSGTAQNVVAVFRNLAAMKNVKSKVIEYALILAGVVLGIRLLQFNAVVQSNIHARHLYESLGFTQLGVIPGGFRMKEGHYCQNVLSIWATIVRAATKVLIRSSTGFSLRAMY